MRLLTIDTETHLIPPVGKVRTQFSPPQMVALGWSMSDPACLTTEWGYSGVVEWNDYGGNLDNLNNTLQAEFDKDTRIVAHNGKFDFAVIKDWNKEIWYLLMKYVHAGRYLDTMVMYDLRYVLMDRRRSLDAIHQHLFGKKLDKGSVRTSFLRSKPLTDEQVKYVMDDVVATYRTAHRLLSVPYGGLAPQKETELIACENLGGQQDPDVLYSTAAVNLHDNLEPLGMMVNQEEVERLREEYQERATTLLMELYEAGYARVKRAPGSEITVSEHLGLAERRWTFRCLEGNTPILQRRWKGELQMTDGVFTLNEGLLRHEYTTIAAEHRLNAPTTDTGSLSMDGDFWREYENLLPDHLKVHLELVKARKYLSSFMGPLSESKAIRAHPSYRIPGAVTGRWACAKPNMQQQPKVLRKMYKAREGSIFVGADYKSLECYTLAHAMNCLGVAGPFVEALQREDDLHTYVAQMVGTERQNAKACTFGLGGGMGNKRFYEYMRYQCKLDVTKEQAAALRHRYRDTFTDFKEYLNLFSINHYILLRREEKTQEDYGLDDCCSHFELSRAMGGRIDCVLPSGRKIPQRGYSEAANCFFQGLGADVITRAFNLCCEKELPICAVVHDAIYLDAPETQQDIYGQELTGCMHQAIKEICYTVECPRPTYDVSPDFF